MAKNKNLLICTSVLQIINFKASLKFINQSSNSENYIFMIHPRLNDSKRVKKIITHYSSFFNFKLFDITDLGKEIDKLTRQLNLSNVGNLVFGKNNNIQSILDSTRKVQTKINDLVIKKIGKVDNVVLRKNHRLLDLVFCKSIEQSFQIYLIDDGIGDYLDKYWHLKNLVFYEIKFSLKKYINKFSIFLLFYFFSKNFNYDQIFYFYRIKKYRNYFCNINNIKNSICIKDEFRKIIKSLFQKKQQHNKIKILIIGSLIGEEPILYNCLYTKDKISIYNQIIEKIKIKHKINNSHIWYIHHPRLSTKTYEILKEKLNCNMYKYNTDHISEVELCNPHLLAVYSITSTTLVYSKLIFLIDSYYINILSLKNKTHPTAYRKNDSTYKKMNFQEIKYEYKQ